MLSRFAIGKRGGVVPNLVVAQRVLDRMATAAKQHLQDETGEAMVGLIVSTPHSGTTLYVLDTIAPDDTAVRHLYTFQQGDERQDDVLYWLQENWRTYRNVLMQDIAPGNPLKVRAATAPLHYLGDWHKHPGHMIHPSGGDLMTAIEFTTDPDNTLGFMVAPILTVDYPNLEEPAGVTTNYLSIPDGDGGFMRVDFWYIDRKSRGFLPITPTVYQDKDLPTLPAYPWHLIDQDRFDQECERLRADGMFLSVTLWDADGEPPMDVCFLLARMDSDKMLILTTPHNYPVAPPTARLAPFIAINADQDMFEVFEEAWKQSEPLDISAFTWFADRWLLDLIQDIETAHNLRKPVPVTVTPTPIIESAEVQLSPEADVESDIADSPKIAVKTDDLPIMAAESMEPITIEPSAASDVTTLENKEKFE